MAEADLEGYHLDGGTTQTDKDPESETAGLSLHLHTLFLDAYRAIVRLTSSSIGTYDSRAMVHLISKWIYGGL